MVLRSDSSVKRPHKTVVCPERMALPTVMCHVGLVSSCELPVRIDNIERGNALQANSHAASSHIFPLNLPPRFRADPRFLSAFIGGFNYRFWIAGLRAVLSTSRRQKSPRQFPHRLIRHRALARHDPQIKGWRPPLAGDRSKPVCLQRADQPNLADSRGAR